MAKAKKQESKADAAAADTTSGSPAPKADAAPKAPAAKKAAAPKKAATTAGGAKKPAAKSASKSAAPGAPQAPLIDTGLAAQAAAAMVANRGAGAAGGSTPAAGKPQESATFKSLKESLNKPAGGLGGILGAGAGQKKFSPNFGGPKHGNAGPGGRNQTFGADVNRAGVPRRTGGG